MSKPNSGFTSKSNEWYTPNYILEYVRRVLGYIDFDPCSNGVANQTVRAKSYSTDSLYIPWLADTVFCNPPYGKGKAKQFSYKMKGEYELGNFREGILLIGSSVHTKWFQCMWKFPVCLHIGRIKFHNSEMQGNGNSHDNVFVYFGDNRKEFIEIFSKIGKVIE
jgi:hypothetical protein